MDNAGSTGMLLSAAKLGNTDVVRDLLGAANVDVNAKDSDGMTAFHQERTYCHRERSSRCSPIIDYFCNPIVDGVW